MTVDYSLAEQVHATAKLKGITSVKLWLGADVMLEYGLEEARNVLVSRSDCLSHLRSKGVRKEDPWHVTKEFCFMGLES